MQDHLRDWSWSVGGSIATAGLDLSRAADWLTIAVGALTLIYTGYKIALVRIQLKQRRESPRPCKNYSPQ